MKDAKAPLYNEKPVTLGCRTVFLLLGKGPVIPSKTNTARFTDFSLKLDYRK